MRKLSILLLIAATGCYSYVPVRTQPLPPGTAVRARLSTPSDFRLTNISVNSAVRVSGEVVQQRPDSLLLSAFSLLGQNGFNFPAAGETVAIPTRQIAVLETKKPQLFRSAGLIVLAGVASALAFNALDSGGTGGGGTPSPRPE